MTMTQHMADCASILVVLLTRHSWPQLLLPVLLLLLMVLPGQAAVGRQTPQQRHTVTDSEHYRHVTIC
jgi:hypothetical protein